MSNIKEIIIEPSKVYTGSNFKIKIKAIRSATYEDINKYYTYKSVRLLFRYNNILDH